MPLIYRVTEIPNSMASHAAYSFRYVVAYWGYSEEFGMVGMHQMRYAGTGDGQEEMVKERFRRDFSNLEIRGVWQEV
jgi:hypothetical protein